MEPKSRGTLERSDVLTPMVTIAGCEALAKRLRLDCPHEVVVDFEAPRYHTYTMPRAEWEAIRSDDAKGANRE